jgi:hypothetical protein
MSRTLSGSGLAIASACSASHALPEVKTPPNEAMARGTACHKYMETAIRHGVERALEEAPESLRGYLSILSPKSYIHDDATFWLAEATYAYCVDSGVVRRIFPRDHRDYSLFPSEIPGTIDLFELYEDDGKAVGVVTDWKFSETDVSPESLQLLFYGLLIAKEHNCDRVITRVVRIDRDGVDHIRTCELGPSDIDDVEARIKRIYHNVVRDRARVDSNATLDVSPGPWCSRCNSILACPMTRHIAQIFGGGGNWDDTYDMAIGDAWSRISVVETATEVAKSRIKAVVDAYGPIQLPGGGNLVRTESLYESVDADIAVDTLMEYGVSLAPYVERRVSKADLERAILGQGGSKEDVRTIMADLRARGGLRGRHVASYRTRMT